MIFDELTPPYRTVVADPPWPYDNANSGGFIRTVKNDGTLARGVTDLGYSTATMSDLQSLPVESLCADDAHLYVWATNAFIVEAHALAQSWGFEPKTVLTWVKTHQDDPCRVSMKTGYYFRGATEHVIFAVRGSQRLLTSDGVPTAFLWPRIGSHSVKPDAFGDLVERCSPGPFVELFCRRPRLGWDSWGKGYEVGTGQRDDP